jgi:hypothetical protein
MWRALAVLSLLVPAACTDAGGAEVRAVGETSSPPMTAVERQPDLPLEEGPPSVVVSAGGTELTLAPWTYCYRSTCADGMPPDDPPHIGSPDEVAVAFPLGGWTFDAFFLPLGATCGRRDTTALDRVTATTHSLGPVGEPGEQVVTLFARGQGQGDLFVSFRWTVPEGAPFTVPTATASIVADLDGRMDSYGVELGASHLAATPGEATASVVVTSAGGDAHDIALRRLPNGCDDATVRFDAPVEDGLRAAALGDPPFTYDVTLTVDGTVHRATAVWPDDVDPECSPCVVLRFDPPLPARD